MPSFCSSRQIKFQTGQGKTILAACRKAGILVQRYLRYRKEYGDLDADQARRLKELGKENNRLKRQMADLSLEKQILKDDVAGN